MCKMIENRMAKKNMITATSQFDTKSQLASEVIFLGKKSSDEGYHWRKKED